MATFSLTKRQNQILTLIREFIERDGYPPSQREIAQHFGISGHLAVQRHLDGLEKKGFIRKGRGARALEVIGQKQGRPVPILGTIAAGRPILAEENRIGTLLLDSSVVRSKNSYLLKVKGDSMTGAGILNGDLVLIKPQADAESGEIVAAMIEGEATVKRLVKKRGRILLQPENPDFDPITVTEKEETFQILGKVVGVLRLPLN
ncbi:MAG: transcriptional repressor LexA [Nitrospiria bacterium]